LQFERYDVVYTVNLETEIKEWNE